MLSMLVKYLAAAAAANPLSVTLKDCGAGTSLFTLNSMDVQPVNPVAGDRVALTLDYTVPSGYIATGGTATYAISLNYIPLSPTEEPLCQNIPCPLTSGTYTNTTYSTWPSGVTGLFTSTMTWKDDSSNLLLCFKMTGNLPNPVDPFAYNTTYSHAF